MPTQDRIWKQPRGCKCDPNNYLIFMRQPNNYPNYGFGPVPRWVFCNLCNAQRFKDYPATEQTLLPCQKKPVANF